MVVGEGFDGAAGAYGRWGGAAGDVGHELVDVFEFAQGGPAAIVGFPGGA